MKQFKAMSVLLSAAMCMSMVVAPVSVPETTETEPSVQNKENEEPSESEKQEPAETEEQKPSETEKQETAETEETDPAAEKPEAEEAEASEQPDAEAEDKKEAVNAIASGKCGKSLTWTISDEGVLTISGKGAMYDYTNNSDKLVPWLQKEEYYKNIKKVIVSKGVTSIGSYAFWYMSAGSFSLPGTLKIIGDHAFKDCENLTEIVIPSSVTTIGDYAFCMCSNLEKVTLPSGITKINQGVFSYCGNLSSITIPGKVKEIGYQAFNGCSSLTSVTIPDGVTTINHQSFGYCANLKEVKIPASVKTIADQAFVGCEKLDTLSLPLFGLETIGESAFEKCYSLTYFIVPFTVTSIGKGAFSWCDKLATVYISEYQKSITNSNTFSNCSDKLEFIVHGYMTKNYAFVYLDTFECKVINPAIDGTGTMAVISINPDYETIAIPNVVTVHNDVADKDVTYKVISINTAKFVSSQTSPIKLKKLVIGANVASIEDKAFSGCSNLVSVTGGAGLKSIGTRAFEKCPKLSVFNITSKTLWKIGPFAFALDKKLKTVQVKKTTKLVKSGVKNSMKGSSVKTVKVKKSKVKKYKKFFKKKNCGKKVKVKK